MSRILFWLALAFLVVAAIRTKLRQAKRQQQMRDDPREAARVEAERAAAARAEAMRDAADRGPSMRAGARAAVDQAGPAETMLCCAHCGVYFPASENVAVDGRDFCSQAHAPLPAR
ncbi:PP0621 family protein [Pseudoduganella namucuonensis]|uniref:Deaminase n=1 Tax=Pseudoduganella namucuonensis TaxID=1035707 RepID=A0A1I7LIM5_9BURK|nr:PP0621 family protein [Pseudoduganella namucuonensis]SFV09525.1 uncharacterized protein SAMN05216552_103027 [Pseudoduganella namucuonensis]